MSIEQKQNKRLYLAALLLGLAAGGLMLFYQKDPPPPNSCADAAQDIGKFARGDVAAFITASHPYPLPELIFSDGNGQPRSLKDFSGKKVLLNLWATWCVPCREEIPTLDRLQKKRGDDLSVVALSLDSGGAEKPKQFFAANKVNSLALYHDSGGNAFTDLRKAGLITGLPTSYLIDRNGCVRGALAGPADWAGEDALKLIDAVKAIKSSR